MECPNCYDKEIHDIGSNMVVKRSYLPMQHTSRENNYDYYQCPRCAMTRRQKSGFLSSGLIENVSWDEAKAATEKADKGSVLGAIAGIGITVLLLSAIASTSND